MTNQAITRVALLLLVLLAIGATGSPVAATAPLTAAPAPTKTVGTTAAAPTPTPAVPPLTPISIQVPGIVVKPAISVGGIVELEAEGLTAAGGGRPIPQRAPIVQGIRRWCCRDRFRCVQVRCGRSIRLGTYLFGGRYATLSQCVAGLCSRQCYITRLQRCPEVPAF